MSNCTLRLSKWLNLVCSWNDNFLASLEKHEKILKLKYIQVRCRQELLDKEVYNFTAKIKFLFGDRSFKRLDPCVHRHSKASKVLKNPQESYWLSIAFLCVLECFKYFNLNVPWKFSIVSWPLATIYYRYNNQALSKPVSIYQKRFNTVTSSRKGAWNFKIKTGIERCRMAIKFKVRLRTLNAKENLRTKWSRCS